MKTSDLLNELDVLGGELTDLEHRVRAARGRCLRIRRVLLATAAPARARQSTVRPSGRSASEVPGHVVDTVAAIPPNGGPVDARTLARLLNVKPSVAATRLQRAAKFGLVRRIGRGRYASGARTQSSARP
jgi:hypothetical protein